jgi:aspartyl-tRNA(Asn)/glutamyl-tRNA(Gln) amidotransferase subunit C
MKLTDADVRRVAQLARLAPPDAALPALAAELGRILDLVEVLDTAATDDVIPLRQPGDPILPLRADAVTESDQREALQAVAPQTAGGYYLVPKVIE